MTWTAAGLGLLVFLLSFVEEMVGARRTQAIVKKRAHAAGSWSALFDALLFLDVILVVQGYWWLVAPICAGSYLGNWWAVQSRHPKRVRSYPKRVRHRERHRRR